MRVQVAGVRACDGPQMCEYQVAESARLDNYMCWYEHNVPILKVNHACRSRLYTVAHENDAVLYFTA